MSNVGTLYIVTTPIGNISDITLRALEILKKVDYILCEDTRVTGKLLNHFEISNKMAPFNDFSEDQKTSKVISDLLSGKQIALVADAGMPLVSDPGYKLVRETINRNVPIESIPGATAVVTALTVSGLPPDKFTFLGYLPKQEGKRTKTLRNVRENQKNIKSTFIIFESPHRLIKTLKSIEAVLGDIDIAVCRELTKIHEEIRREKVSESFAHFSKVKPKGEFVILF